MADAIERANEVYDAALIAEHLATIRQLPGYARRAAIRAMLAFARQAPEGWVLVPREPTEAMIRAWIDAEPDCDIGELPSKELRDAAMARGDWSAMLDASPSVGEGV